MPVPRKLLEAAFETLCEPTLRDAGEHCDIRKREQLSVQQLAKALARDPINFLGYSHSLSFAELKATAKVFGIPPGGKSETELRGEIYLYVDDYDKRRERARKAKLASHLPAMTAEELMTEARKLARPAKLLTTKRNGPVAALWYADSNKKALGLRPWISIDLRHHPDPRVRRTGILDILVDDCECEVQSHYREGELKTPQKQDRRLYSEEFDDVPNLELLFLRGPANVQSWLDKMEEHGWKNRQWPSDPAFPLETPILEYRKAWRKIHPLYTNVAFAQLGGWPVTWPEQRAEDQLGRKLVVRTYRCAEPWIEVFTRGSHYYVEHRIT